MKNITFKKFIIILSLVLTLLMAIILVYVVDSVKKYEDNQLDNYMANFIESLKDTSNEFTIEGASDIKPSAFDKADASIRSGLAYLAENDSLIFKQSSESKNADNPVFDVYSGDNPLIRVTLNAKDSTTRLGMFDYKIWEVKEIKMLRKNGLFDCEISLPNSYTVEVNGKKLTEKQCADSLLFIGLPEISKKSGLSYQMNYQLEGLVGAPEIKVTDKNGQPVECEMKGTKLTKAMECEKIADEATAKSKIKNYPDVQYMARQWSLFVSSDLHDAKRGFETIKELLVEGTYFYHFAKKYAESVDITYVSRHGFDKEKFSDEKRCNFEIYSDRDFSCDVFLQKNFIVHTVFPDKMAERMHFVYYDDTDDGKDNPTWKIIGIKSIAVN